MESSYFATFDVQRWRALTVVVSALAAIELALLIGIGTTYLAKSAAHRIKDTAIARVAALPEIPKTAPPGVARLTRRQTQVLVLNGSGATGAASSAADGLERQGYRIAAVGNAREQSSSTRTLVMYRRGYRAEAARLARDVRTRLVTPLDGMKRSALLGAQVVLVVGR